MTAKANAKCLRDLAGAKGIRIGSAVVPDLLRRVPEYASTLAREFSALTAENVMKVGALQPEQGRFEFADADYMIGFAEAHGMAVRGHTFVWHMAVPEWLEKGEFSSAQLAGVLAGHIQEVAGRYAGRIAWWDVVNESIEDKSFGMRDTLWHRGLGQDYIAQAFRWAHQADPKAKLFYNDYGAEGMGKKSEAVYALVRKLLDEGVPIHGVGLQMHITAGPERPAAAEIGVNIRRLRDLGLEVHVTELDVRLPAPVTSELLATQAQVYAEVARSALDAGASALTLWGFTDAHSWIPKWFAGFDAGLIFDEQYQPKPAYRALARELA